MKDDILNTFNTNDVIEMTNAGFEIANMNVSYGDLMGFLKSGDANLINAALLKISTLKNKEDTLNFISKLVGNETKIRELTSFKLIEFIQKTELRDFLQSREILTILIKGIDDVNPSVCRNVIASLEFVDDVDFLFEQILNKIQILSDEISKIKDVKSHENSKKIFNLYWNLQSLGFLTKTFPNKLKPFKENMVEIIMKNKDSLNYQLREKSSIICFNLLCIFDDKELFDLKNHFSNDENFYVRKVFVH